MLLMSLWLYLHLMHQKDRFRYRLNPSGLFTRCREEEFSETASEFLCEGVSR